MVLVGGGGAATVCRVRGAARVGPGCGGGVCGGSLDGCSVASAGALAVAADPVKTGAAAVWAAWVL